MDLMGGGHEWTLELKLERDGAGRLSTRTRLPDAASSC